MTELGLFLAGLVLLVGGAELLVRGARRAAVRLGMSPLVVGLTVVALGTSTPELAVSVGSALGGNADLALGNAVGSNIANVLLILGLCAVIAPLVVASRLIRIEVPIMVAVSLAVLGLAVDGRIGRVDGLVLVALLAGYLFFLVRSAGDVGEPESDRGTVPGNLASIASGVAGLVFGAELLLGSAMTVAQRIGLSDLVIGLTLVAVGTSLPELATSVMAVVRGQRDMAVGNVVGSNILNLLAVLGPTAMLATDGVPVAPGALDFDLPVMTAVAVACLPIFATGHRISRWEAVVFLGYYAAYTVYLLLDSTGHDALEPFSAIMLWFVVPVTCVGLLTSLVRWRRGSTSERGSTAQVE